jgi:hypothetical protein
MKPAHLLALGAGNYAKTTVLQGGIYQGDPDGYYRVARRPRPVRLVLMPRDFAGGHLWNFGPHIVNRVGEDFRPDQTLDHVEELGIAQELEVPGPGHASSAR